MPCTANYLIPTPPKEFIIHTDVVTAAEIDNEAITEFIRRQRERQENSPVSQPLIVDYPSRVTPLEFNPIAIYEMFKEWGRLIASHNKLEPEEFTYPTVQSYNGIKFYKLKPKKYF